jgi:TolA-binding protein
MRLLGQLAAGMALLALLGATSPVGGTTQSDAVMVDTLDLDGVVRAIREDCAALRQLMAELQRRYPDDREPITCALPDGGVAIDVARMDDDTLVETVEARSTRLNQLAARGEALKKTGATLSPALAAELGLPTPSERPAAPKAPTPPAPPRSTKPKPTPTPGGTKAYCKAMYAKAYSLCGTLGDRSCKFTAADHWGICEKTGRWP